MIDLTPAEWIDAARIAGAVQQETPEEFEDLCNDVLNEIAVEIGARRGCVHTSLAVFENDDGLDATCIEAGTSISPWIPDPELVGYQYKSGENDKSAGAVVRDDVIDEDGVMELLEADGSFVYITAWDRSDFQGDIRDEATDEGIDEYSDQLYYIGGDTLARQIQRLPALLARRGMPLSGLLTFNEWGELPDLRNPFETDESTQARLEDLRKRVQQPSARLRVVGRPGDGKTRTVHEAIKGSGLEDYTLYARRPDDVPDRFRHYLRTTEAVKCTLVVDEVDPASMRDFEEKLELARSEEIAVVLIGSPELSRHRSQSADVLEVEPLSPELLTEIIISAEPGLPRDQAEELAHVCSGSPGMALLLVQVGDVAEGFESRQQLLADRDVQNAVDTSLGIDFTEIRWEATAAVALVDYVGWGDEADRLFEAAHLDAGRARSAVTEMHRNSGILPVGANVRYVSPEVLAQHLAAKRIREWSPRQVIEFLGLLTPRLADGFASRVREVGSALGSNQSLVEDAILGDEGPFQTLGDLERGRASRVVRHLAGPYRHATVQLLHRVVGPASKEELEAATDSRRDLVRALEEVLWFEDVFEDAAYILLQLAAAENESWGNNATGIWTETFQTFLGRTKAGKAPRIRMVRTAAESDDPDERRLAAQAIKAGLQSGHESRMGMPPEDIEDVPEEAWQPETYGEWADLVRGYLNALEPLLDDTEEEVRRAAIEALEEGSHHALTLTGTLEPWLELADVLTDRGYRERASLAKRMSREARRLRNEIDDERDSLSEEKMSKLEKRLEHFEDLRSELEGDDFVSRFRRALTMDYYDAGSEYQEAKEKISKALRTIASEVLEEPDLLASQWMWLLDERPAHCGEFFHELGRQDCDRSVEGRLTQATLDREETWSWLAIYDLGFLRSCADDESWVGQRLDALRELGAPAEQRLDFVVRAGYSPTRFKWLLEIFETGELPEHSIARLKYGHWTPDLSIEEVEQLLDVMEWGAKTSPHLVTFLYGFLDEHKGAVEDLLDTVLDLLDEPVSEHEGQTFDYEWTELAKLCLPEAPLRVALAAANRIAQLQATHRDRLSRLVRRAWEVGSSQEIFEEVLVPAITPESPGAWWVHQALSPFPLEDLGTDRICAWIDEEPDDRAHGVARFIGAPRGDRPSHLHAELLERFKEYGVEEAFYGELISGSWTGSASARTRSLIEQVERWEDDDRDAIREWAEKTRKWLEGNLERDQKRELKRKIQRGKRPPKPDTS